MRGPIVAGTDGSDASRQVIAEVGRLAHQSGRSVVVVFIRQIKHVGSVSVFAMGALGYLRESAESERTIAHAQAIAELDPLGVTWRFVTRDGQAGTRLMRTAAEYGADTIAIPGECHGVFGIGRNALMADLLRRWPYSLYVVRPYPR